MYIIILNPNNLRLIRQVAHLEGIPSVKLIIGVLRNLFSALDWYSGVFSQRTGIPVQLVGAAFALRLPLSVETVLFRLAQEALHNVAKHAQARRVTLRLASNGKDSCLIIEDDGLDFNTDLINTPSEAPHWGLMSMQERAASVGGQLTIQSDPGVGTRVQVNLGAG